MKMLLLAVLICVPVFTSAQMLATVGLGSAANAENFTTKAMDCGWSLGVRFESFDSRTCYGVSLNGTRFSIGNITNDSYIAGIELRHFVTDDSKRYRGLYLITDIGYYFGAGDNNDGLVLMPGIGGQYRMNSKARLFIEGKYILGATTYAMDKVVTLRVGAALVFWE